MAQGVNLQTLVTAVLAMRSQCDTLLAILESAGAQVETPECPHENREVDRDRTVNGVVIAYRCKDCGARIEEAVK